MTWPDQCPGADVRRVPRKNTRRAFECHIVSFHAYRTVPKFREIVPPSIDVGEQATGPQDLPVGFVGVMDNGAFAAADNQVALGRVSAGDVSNLDRKPDAHAHVVTVQRMACRRQARRAGSL